MKPFGDRLKEARLARNVSLDTIASDTHVARHYLDALERSDLDSLPGGPFNKGYIRSYAQHLGIDPNPILEVYAVEERRRGRGTPESQQQMMEEFSRLVGKRTTRKRGYLLFPSAGIRLALTLLAVSLLVAGGRALLRSTAVSDHDSRVAPRPSDWPEPLVPSEASAEAKGDGDGSQAGEIFASHPPVDTQSPKAILPEKNTRPHPSRLAVTASGFGTRVVERRLVGKSDQFREGVQVWFWTRAVGGRSGEMLRHVWLYEGRPVMNAELTVGGPHWRTYSRFTLPSGSIGRWVVEVRRSDGAVLASEEFLCLPTPDSQSRS